MTPGMAGQFLFDIYVPLKFISSKICGLKTFAQTHTHMFQVIQNGFCQERNK